MDKTTKKIQTEKTFEAFREEPKTMLQVAKETGILRGNICRYVDHFRKQGEITKVREGKCPISKHKATFYSTDPAYFKPQTQSELFPKKTKSKAYQL